MSSFPLSKLPSYGVCRVVGVEECAAKNRMTGLGITEGAELIRLFCAPSGDPVAYSVRGTAVALRLSDAEKVIVTGDDKWV